MGVVKFEVSDLKDYAEQLKRLPNDIPDILSGAVKEASEMLIAEVSKRTPVKTGRLKAAWIEDNKNTPVEIHGNIYSRVVKNTTPYARNIEYGERKGVAISTKGKYMLKNSEQVVQNSTVVDDYIRKELRKRIGGGK